MIYAVAAYFVAGFVAECIILGYIKWNYGRIRKIHYHIRNPFLIGAFVIGHAALWPFWLARLVSENTPGVRGRNP